MYVKLAHNSNSGSNTKQKKWTKRRFATIKISGQVKVLGYVGMLSQPFSYSCSMLDRALLNSTLLLLILSPCHQVKDELVFRHDTAESKKLPEAEKQAHVDANATAGKQPMTGTWTVVGQTLHCELGVAAFPHTGVR